MKKLAFVFSLMVCNSIWAQNQKELEQVVMQEVQSSFEQFKALLSIPNDANYPEDIAQNINWIESAFEARGFSTVQIQTEGAPLVLAQRNFHKKASTLLVYLQVDGQPVDSSRWFQENPYKVALKAQNSDGSWSEMPWENIKNYDPEWRIFARSASDAKGPITMFLSAVDALERLKMIPDFNLKVILDFEEELGSPNLPAAVLRNKELLKADRLVIFDGPRHRLNKPTLTFGARGISTIQLTTYGPIVPQHSGHFGNYAPNPAFKLARLLSSMKDEEGRVLIEGYYEGVVLDEETKKILAQTPQDDELLKEVLQLAVFDKVADNYQEAIQYPSLNIRGMQSGWINEEVRTIVPAWARAEIDVRLVKEISAERLIGLIQKHVEDQGFLVLDREPTKEERKTHKNIATMTSEISYQSFRTDLNGPTGKWLQSALFRGFEEKPILQRMSGGSIPIAPFVNALNVPAVTVPTVNRDNNQHSPNENIRLGNYVEGIKTILAILTEPF